MTRNVLLCLAVPAAAAALAAGPGASGATASPRATRAERAIVTVVNQMRVQRGLPPLRLSRRLNRAADAHTHEMLRNDYFDHVSSDGSSFARRIHRYTRAGLVGEALAALGQRDGVARAVVQMWMNSPPHREVLLTRGFRRIGVGRHWGTLSGRGYTVVTADFAS
jgi:uncharacterized protein YkwD